MVAINSRSRLDSELGERKRTSASARNGAAVPPPGGNKRWKSPEACRAKQRAADRLLPGGGDPFYRAGYEATIIEKH
jgi:hypothetical protein